MPEATLYLMSNVRLNEHKRIQFFTFYYFYCLFNMYYLFIRLLLKLRILYLSKLITFNVKCYSKSGQEIVIEYDTKSLKTL